MIRPEVVSSAAAAPDWSWAWVNYVVGVCLVCH